MTWQTVARVGRTWWSRVCRRRISASIRGTRPPAPSRTSWRSSPTHSPRVSPPPRPAPRPHLTRHTQTNHTLNRTAVPTSTDSSLPSRPANRPCSRQMTCKPFINYNWMVSDGYRLSNRIQLHWLRIESIKSYESDESNQIYRKTSIDRPGDMCFCFTHNFWTIHNRTMMCLYSYRKNLFFQNIFIS